jgi:hypothetical protein
MLTVYLFALGFGLSVLGALLVMGGGKDADGGDGGDGHDHDGDANPGADHAHAPDTKGDLLRAGPAKALLSLRFWVFFAAAFGATGALATLLGVDPLATFLAAVPTGLGVGGGAAWLFQAIRSDVASGDTSLSALAGEEATVAVAVRPGARGKVRVQRPSGTTELLATSRDAATLEVGAKVLITSVDSGGVADVTAVRPNVAPPPPVAQRN